MLSPQIKYISNNTSCVLTCESLLRTCYTDLYALSLVGRAAKLTFAQGPKMS